MKSILALILVSLSLCPATLLAEPDARAKAEVARLFDALRSSQCQFFRNGSWYPPSKAADHLQRKYEYLLKKDLVSTAESFIERAATASSTSGKPYLVKCGDALPVESSAWFKEQLSQYRAASK